MSSGRIAKLVRVSNYKYLQLLGIRFINESVDRCVEITREGGLLVVPSGPGLAGMEKDPSYKAAVQGATFALADSGYMVLLYRILKQVSVKRISGLNYISRLIEAPFFKKANVLWVMPRENEVEAAKNYLKHKGIDIENSRFIIAPLYAPSGNIEDASLLEQIETHKPEWVVLNIAGGIQEKLGFYLHSNLSYNPTIICTGAAIAFLSGAQTRIPPWADRLYLGWLLRIISSPRKYLKRYLSAFRLFFYVLLQA